MTYTTNYNLEKPDYTDQGDVDAINDNMDTVDMILKSHETSISKILPVITGSTNNSGYAISAGEYFEANGGLYKATATIPTGSSWSSSATALSEHGAINALNSKLTSIDAGTYNIHLLKGKYNGIWRFYYDWVDKSTAKNVTVNSCKVDGTSVQPSAIAIQPFNDYVQFYSTASAFDSAENYVEFNITVTVS